MSFFSPITKRKFSLHKAFQTATFTGFKINPRMAFPVEQTNLVSFIFFFQVTSLLPSAGSSPQTLGGRLKELCSQSISPSLNPKMFLPHPKQGKVLSKTNAAAFILQVGLTPKDTALLPFPQPVEPGMHGHKARPGVEAENEAFTSQGSADVCTNPPKSVERSGRWRAALQTGIGGAGQLEPAVRANHSLGCIKELGNRGLSHWPL